MNKDILDIGLTIEQWETILLLLTAYTESKPMSQFLVARIGVKHLKGIKVDIEAQVSL